jgi:Undecaprenyl-phosphate galactose phosphotransferase WbaP
VFDVGGVLLLGILALPLLALITLAVKLDSRGPVFFGHKRIGQGGNDFRAWKFRSMVTNADEALHEHFNQNPEAFAEWKAKHKLRDDPRVTKVGRLLRKTSLDELPQLWNVLVGQMSLVGPRPIVNAERHHYREQIVLYEGVLPGLSGLWQVSGRSDTTYEERVQLDTYYICNWSIWLDVCILARTIPALIFGRGAC